MRSPFVEFRAEMETLSNITINMNLTMIESLSGEPMESEAIMKEYNSFYRAGTAAAKKNQSTDRYFEMENVYANMKQLGFLQNDRTLKGAQQNPRFVHTTPTTTTVKPAIVNIAMQKQQEQQQHQQPPRRIIPEVKIIEVAHDQYIKPLALQNMQPNEPKKSSIFQDSSTNIEDLKRHIVLLHNLTKQDNGFESKFVVFPNLKKDETTSTTSTTAPPPSTTSQRPKPRTTRVKTTRSSSTSSTTTSTAKPIETTTEMPTTLPPTTTAQTETELPESTTTSYSTTNEQPRTSTLPNDVNQMDDMDMPASERSPALVLIKPTVVEQQQQQQRHESQQEKAKVVDDDFFSRLEQVTSFPQVLLQNDQTPPTLVTDELQTSSTQKTPGGGKNRKNKLGKNRRNNNRKDKNRLCREVGNKFIGNCTFAQKWDDQNQEEDRVSTQLPVNGENKKFNLIIIYCK